MKSIKLITPDLDGYTVEIDGNNISVKYSESGYRMFDLHVEHLCCYMEHAEEVKIRYLMAGPYELIIIQGDDKPKFYVINLSYQEFSGWNYGFQNQKS